MKKSSYATVQRAYAKGSGRVYARSYANGLEQKFAQGKRSAGEGRRVRSGFLAWRRSLASLGTVLAAGFLLLAPVVAPSAGAEGEPGAEISSIPATGEGAGSGSLRLRTLTGETLVDAPCLDTEADIRVSAMIARARVIQRFKNPGKDWAEGIYIFPLPEDAAVDRMRIRVGERVIEGEIRERAEAKKIYEAARISGRRSGLVEQERPNVFTTSVANIAPGEEVSVEIEYQQTVRYDQGRFRLRFPLVVAPRYIPGLPLASEEVSGFSGSGWARDTNEVPDASRVTPLVAEPAEGRLNPVRIRVLLDPGFPLASVESRFHRVHTEQEGQHGYRVELEEGSVPADRDFELVWEPQVGTEPAALFTERWEGSDYGLLMVMPPAARSGIQPAGGRELILVVDTSGSMHGPSIDQAKLALKAALRRLSPTDRFNLIQFNNRTSSLFPRPMPARDDHLRRASSYIDHLRANGGTEMQPALRLALAGGSDEGGLRQVVFLTDGSVGNEQALFATIQQGLGTARLFTVGIGSAPNSHFMRRAARFGRGTFTYIGRTDEVEERMQALFSKLEHVAMTELQLQLPETAQGGEVWPAKIPDLYLGEPLVVSLSGAQLAGTLRLQGRLAASVWQQEIKLEGGASSPGVHGLWARRKIAALMDEKAKGKSESEVREAVLEVALGHRLVSRYTSLVAVDKTPARPEDQTLYRNPVPVNLPHGWSAEKVFGRLPQTATLMPLHLLAGMIALLLGIALWRRQELRPQ